MEKLNPTNWIEEIDEITKNCSLYKPLMMVIPESGTIISCSVHKEGHKIYGPPKITC